MTSPSSTELVSRIGAGWEQRPVHIRDALPAPLWSEALVMRAIVAACELERRAAAPTQRVRCFVHNARVEADLPDYLPHPEESLAAYRDRVRTTTAGRGFGLVADELERSSFELWATVSRFLRPIVAPHPPRHASIGVFLGDNPTTGFGVHRDPHSTLMMVLAGEKTLRLWPEHGRPAGRSPAEFAGSTRYTDIEAHGAVITARAGDVVYWPASYFHVAENPRRSLVSTLNIALGNDWLTPRLFMSGLREHAVSRLRREYLPRSVHGGSIDPSVVAEACDMLEASRPPPGATRRAVTLQLARLRSTAGLATPPEPGARSLTDEDQIVIADPNALVVERYDPEHVVIAACGHLLDLEASPPLLAMLERLDPRHPQRIADLCDPGDEPSSPTRRAVLQALADAGALQIVGEAYAPGDDPAEAAR